MAFIRQVDESEAAGLTKKVYEAARARAGTVAHIIKVMSRDAASTQASMSFYIQLMHSDNALSSARKEMLATVVSNVNDCYY